MTTGRIIYNIISSPIGEIVAGATPAGCCVCEFHDRGGVERIRTRVERRHGTEMIRGTSDLIAQLEAEIGEYFEGTRTEFTLPLDLQGTDFQRRVTMLKQVSKHRDWLIVFQ